jgi:hypothetical protein
MEQNQQEIIAALNNSAKNLRQGIDAHCSLVSAMLGQSLTRDDRQALFSFCPRRARELRLEQAIEKAIDIIEESRKAFKSKKLEMLRKDLTRALIDAE